MEVAQASGSLIGFLLEDRYRIVREIGRGGMGVVYEGEHVELGKRVAIKVMLEKYADNADAVARFRREALAASRIGNAHIIDVSHIGTGPLGRPFVVMELLEGLPLAQVIKQTGHMPPWRAVHIMRQVLRAVGAAHGKGIIHRDLKPDNIFLIHHDDQHDFVKLLDFGISKIVETGEHVAITQLTTTGLVMGTPLYMSPEQATGSAVGPQADVYACGVILYEMLAGRPPFDETNYNVLVAKLLTAQPPDLGTRRKGLPSGLIAAVHRALEKEPEQRFASAEAFAAALPSPQVGRAEVLELETAGTVGVPTAKRPKAGRSRWPYAILVAVLAGGAAAAVIVTRQTDQPAPAPQQPAPAPAPKPATPIGKLEVKTVPAGAGVKIDGADSGTSPIEIMLPPGTHRLHVELPGFTAVDEDEEVHVDERAAVVFTLQPVAPTRSEPKPVKPHPEKLTKPEPKTIKATPKADPIQPENPYDRPEPPTKTPPPVTGPKPNPY